MWSFFLEWNAIHKALAEGTGWIPRQRHLNSYNLPGAKVTITFLILIVKKDLWGEKPATSPAIPETTPLPAGLYASVAQNIFYYILSALFQGRGVPLAVRWVRKPQNAALTPTSSCCESAESLILTMNQHWQQSIKRHRPDIRGHEPKKHKNTGYKIHHLTAQVYFVLSSFSSPLPRQTCVIYPSESSDLWSPLVSSYSLVCLSWRHHLRGPELWLNCHSVWHVLRRI